MAWVYLITAGIFEVAWAFGLKHTDGWTKLYPSLGTAAAMIVSFHFLSLALKTIPLGTGYAIWTGIGAVGTAIVGIAFLGERPKRLSLKSMRYCRNSEPLRKLCVCAEATSGISIPIFRSQHSYSFP